MIHTCFISINNREANSKREKASNLSKLINSSHHNIDISQVVEDIHSNIGSLLKDINNVSGFTAFDKSITIEMIETKARDMMIQILSEIIPLSKGQNKELLLILSAVSMDKGVLGYFTKYDSSVGDLNLIGSLHKSDIKNVLKRLCELYGSEPSECCILRILQANESKEILPFSESMQTSIHVQNITPDEIKQINVLRMSDGCGLVSIFERLIEIWPNINLDQLESKLNNFYEKLMVNRPAMNSLPRCVHLTKYNSETSRHDLRPYIYDDALTLQRKEIFMMKEKKLRSKGNKTIESSLASKA